MDRNMDIRTNKQKDKQTLNFTIFASSQWARNSDGHAPRKPESTPTPTPGKLGVDSTATPTPAWFEYLIWASKKQL
jgi:hypothetical protein